jgi:hypothetical protein
MPTSPYFNHFDADNEQTLIHSLSQEFIRNYGIDVTYLPRERLQEDLIFGESTIDKFSDSYDVEMYIESTDAFEGEGQLFAQFGLELKDRITLAVNPLKFTEYTGMDKPLEGDLIYFPLSDSLFEVTNVPTDRSIFYPTGTIPFYSLQCELFVYANEQFETGDLNIDDLADVMGTPISSYPNIPDSPAVLQDWRPNYLYNVGDVCRPTVDGNWTGLYYKVIQIDGLGLSNVSEHEPRWPSSATDQINDNHVLWEAVGVNNEFDAFKTESDEVISFDDFDPFHFVMND